MKLTNTITHFFLFIVVWPLFTWGAWDVSQTYTASTLMPWILQLVNQSSDGVSFALAAGMAVVGSFLAVICTFVVLLLVSIGWHRLKAAFVKGR